MEVAARAMDSNLNPDRMERALCAVLDRHSATEYGDLSGNTGVGCWQCGTDVFPCPTVAAIEEALR